jgi:hypothetical protein
MSLQSTFSSELTASRCSWYGIRGMVNADGTIEAHTEDRRFVTRVHGMSVSHRRVRRELIEDHSDEGLREPGRGTERRTGPSRDGTETASILIGSPSDLPKGSVGRAPSACIAPARPTTRVGRCGQGRRCPALGDAMAPQVPYSL